MSALLHLPPSMMPVMPMIPIQWVLNWFSRPWCHDISSANKASCKHDEFFQLQWAATVWGRHQQHSTENNNLILETWDKDKLLPEMKWYFHWSRNCKDNKEYPSYAHEVWEIIQCSLEYFYGCGGLNLKVNTSIQVKVKKKKKKACPEENLATAVVPPQRS